jgi:hypothetical protein
MPQDKHPPSSEHHKPTPLAEEKGLQPAKNPPPMLKVKPPKQEKIE